MGGQDLVEGVLGQGREVLIGEYRATGERTVSEKLVVVLEVLTTVAGPPQSVLQLFGRTRSGVGREDLRLVVVGEVDDRAHGSAGAHVVGIGIDQR